ncbi:MAG: KOW domain-containing RNA-binding protein [Defluviitaleaceae bacterium]|nr:KOW domain-containing RNA-binding protein [Defluviitaleaceae bacterium]
MDALKLGQIVFSKQGRDRGSAYVVTGTFVEAGKEYAYLADGRLRPAGKPKKKKLMHIQPTKEVMPVDLDAEAGALNACLRKMLEEYN